MTSFDGSFAFDPDWAHGAVATLQSKEGALQDTYSQLVTAIQNFKNANGGQFEDPYDTNQTKYSQAHEDHEVWLKDGYTRLNSIIDQYQYGDKQSAAGFGF